MKEMSIDLETYSDIDIKKSGAYKYAESDNFEILLFGVSVDNSPVAVYDLAAGDEIPAEILTALSDENVTKWAFNASFERVCLSNWLRRHHPEYFYTYSIEGDPVRNYLDPTSWKCTMIWSAYMGLPLSLEGVGAVLKLQDQKMKEGKDLIKYFCTPCRPTKSNGGRTRNLPEHAPEKWETFKAYNKRDVEAELAIKQRLAKYPVPGFIWDEYHLDQEINDRGIMLDMDVVENAIAFDERSKFSLMKRMQTITNLDNPNSVAQMKEWLSDNGVEMESLGKQLIRTAFIARPGYKFIVSDYSAIEARVLAHLAGETWRSKVFAEEKDIYCASASQMFGVPVEKHGVNGHLRQKGKIAELALGYGGSVGALKSMGALEMGLSEDELQPLVDSWRASNPMITAFWWDIDRAVKQAIKERIPTEVRGVKFFYKSGMLFIKLPSGRCLSYVKPRIGENQFGGESVTYEGVGATKKWERIESYGPKFVENIVQAVSRDLLCFAMKNLRYCFIVGHVHDEVIIEASKDVDVKAICDQMSRTPDWMPDILIKGDGYQTFWYRKD